jgi:hypothetical protein
MHFGWGRGWKERCVKNTETREGWSLLSAETEAIKAYKGKDSFLGWFAALFVPVQEIFVLPWLL